VLVVYDFLLVAFAVSHAVFEKFDVKQSNDLEIRPRSLTVVSPGSCHVAMYVKCSEDSERMKRKSPFLTTSHSFDATSPSNPREYLHSKCIELRGIVFEDNVQSAIFPFFFYGRVAIRPW